MGRIKGRKPEETRASVLEAATKAFAEHGFANATLATIARDAGVTAATLPYHFGDKQGLYDAVIDGIYKEMIAFGEGFAFETPFAEVMARVYRWSRERRDAIRVMIRSIMEAGSVQPRMRDTRMAPAIQIIGQMASRRWDVPVERAKVAVIALTHLTTRFVTNSVVDNMAAFGVDTEEDCHARIEALLIDIGTHLMGLDRPDEAAGAA